MALVSYATVWDEQVAGIRQALRMMPEGALLILSDSVAAIKPIVNAADMGSARTRDLREVADMIGERQGMGHSVRLGWVKAHVGIEGNEVVDAIAKGGCRAPLCPVIMEGGIRDWWHSAWQEERCVAGAGMGRVVRWGRKAVRLYSQ